MPEIPDNDAMQDESVAIAQAETDRKLLDDEQAEKEKGAKLTYYRADDDARRVAAAAGRIMQGKF